MTISLSPLANCRSQPPGRVVRRGLERTAYIVDNIKVFSRLLLDTMIDTTALQCGDGSSPKTPNSIIHCRDDLPDS